MSEQSENNRRRAREYKRKYEAAMAELAAITAERDEAFTALEEVTASHDELATERDELTGKQKADAHRKAFDKLTSTMNVDPAHVDDLWTLLGLKTEGDKPDEAAIGKAIKDAVKKRPHMIAKAKDDDEEEEEGNEKPEGDEAGGQGDEEEGDDDEAPAPAKTKAPAKPAGKLKGEAPPKMERGEGNARGSRAKLTPPSMDEIIDQDFEATGRTDAFKI
jgi:hypothetical protein